MKTNTTASTRTNEADTFALYSSIVGIILWVLVSLTTSFTFDGESISPLMICLIMPVGHAYGKLSRYFYKRKSKAIARRPKAVFLPSKN